MDFLVAMHQALGESPGLSQVRMATRKLHDCCRFVGSLDNVDWILCRGALGHDHFVYSMEGDEYLGWGSLDAPFAGVPLVVLDALHALTGAL